MAATGCSSREDDAPPANGNESADHSGSQTDRAAGGAAGGLNSRNEAPTSATSGGSTGAGGTQAGGAGGLTVDPQPDPTCDPGEWKGESSGVSCQRWTDCPSGTFVSTEPSATQDRTCTACPSNTFSAGTNDALCLPTGQIDCIPGEFVVQEPSSWTDRICQDCPHGLFSTVDNAVECIPWPGCDEGEILIGPGDSTSNVRCADGWWYQDFYGRNQLEAAAIAVDANSDVFAAGSGRGFPGFTNAGLDDVYLVKLDGVTGLPLWAHQIGSSEDDVVLAAKADAAGHVYVAGYVRNSGVLGDSSYGGEDGFVIKFSDTGTAASVDWVVQLGTSGHERISAIDITPTGVPIIGMRTNGDFGSAIGNYDVVVAELDPATGATQWLTQLGSTKNDFPTSLILLADGSIVVGGSTQGDFHAASSGSSDLFLVGLSADGQTEEWGLQLGSTETDSTEALATSANAIYFAAETDGSLAGFTNPSPGEADIVVGKLTLQGVTPTVEWLEQFGDSGEETVAALTAAGGDIRLVGSLEGTVGPGQKANGLFDIYFAKVTSAGMGELLQLGTTQDDIALDAALSPGGMLAISGSTDGTLGERNRNNTNALTGAIQW